MAEKEKVVEAIWAVIDRAKELALAEVAGVDESAQMKFHRALNHLSDVLGISLSNGCHGAENR